MHNHSSETLRSRLADLELSAERSAVAFSDARVAHAKAIKAAVLHGDHTAAEHAEVVLAAASATYTHALALVEEARTCLAAALRVEKAEAKDKARLEAEVELASMASDADDIDGAFAALVDRVMKLRAREIALRNRTRQTHREATGGPEHLNALRSLASYLNAAASCLNPDAPKSVTRAVAAGTKAIRSALQ